MSTQEIENVYNALEDIFENVIPDYDGDEKFKFSCSFYAIDDDVYIDFVDKYDEEKEKYAKENNIKYCVFLSSDEFFAFINSTIIPNFTDKELRSEYNTFFRRNGTMTISCPKNKIIRTFQFYNLYQNEIRLFRDFYIRYKLFRNRKKYLGLEYKDITPTIILNGFKISGIHYGFSMFNPGLAKWFIQTYNLKNKICYDPCGGWGHRLIGIAPYVKKYIYNDLSTHTVDSCKDIAKFIGVSNVEFYNEDARLFNPNDDYDFMFTCPPYYENNHDLEEYECDGFKSEEDYEGFISSLYGKFIKKDSCKIFGLVIKDNMIPNWMKEKSSETYCLSKKCRTHFNRTSKSNKKNNYEYLYIFKK